MLKASHSAGPTVSHPEPLALTMSSTKKSILVFSAAVGMLGGFNALFFSTLSIFLKPIAASFGWGRGELAAVALLALLASAIVSPLVGKLIAKYGPMKIISASIMLLAISLFGMSKLTQSLLLLGGLSVCIGAFGTATTPLGYLSSFPKYFDKRLGLAMGCAMTGLGLGSAIAPVLAQNLISTHGWREAYVWLAVIAIMIGTAAISLNHFFGPDSLGVTRNKSMQFRVLSSATLEGADVKVALRSFNFWLFAIVMFAVSLVTLGAAIHLFSILTDRGISPVVAASVVSSVGIAVAVGRFVSGALLDVFPAKYVAIIGFLLAAVGLVIIASSGSETAVSILVCGATLFGIAIGAEGDLIPFIVRRYFGLKAFSTIFGCLFSAYLLGGILGPVLYGRIFDVKGSYDSILYIGGGVCVVSALLILLAGPYRYTSAKPSALS